MLKSPIHKSFALNGKSFSSKEGLLGFSETINSDIARFFNQWFDENDFVEVQTSGSTGEPKSIRLQKVNMINSALATGSYFNLSEKTKALLCMSPNYIAGKMMLVRAMVLGWKLDIISEESAPLKRSKKTYDFAAMVPLQLHSSLADIDKVKLLIVGGGPVSVELYDKIQSVETKIYATYGMTETISHVAAKKLNHHSDNFKDSTYAYEALPNVRFSSDDRNCLVIEAWSVADDKITTNDMVELISEKSFTWLGRYDNIINSGGIKLIPEQIEDKLAVILNDPFFVTGKSDPVLGEQLILIVESRDIKSESEIARLIKKLPMLGRFERPKQILFLEKFVRTVTGKINRIETIKLAFG